MALIKGKQIQSLAAAKVVETAEKQFVSSTQVTSFANKAEVTAVEAVKTEAAEALAAARIAITGEVGTAKTEAIEAANTHADAAVKVVDGKVVALDTRVGTAENSLVTGLQDRYTKNEIDAKLSQLGAGIKYKGTVASFDEIATKFPTPEEGWLVAVEGTKNFYVYDVETVSWEAFPIDLSINTTYAKAIRIAVTDSQTVINTGIKTNATGSLQTTRTLIKEVALDVNGVAQAKDVDFTVAEVSDEIQITWISSDFALEATDVITVTFNQTV